MKCWALCLQKQLQCSDPTNMRFGLKERDFTVSQQSQGSHSRSAGTNSRKSNPTAFWPCSHHQWGSEPLVAFAEDCDRKPTLVTALHRYKWGKPRQWQMLGGPQYTCCSAPPINLYLVNKTAALGKHKISKHADTQSNIFGCEMTWKHMSSIINNTPS